MYGSLHCHTARGSNVRLLDSIVRIPKLVERAIEYGYNFVGITDHESLSAHVQAVQIREEVQKEHPDFKIILGNEIYLIDETEYKNPPKFFHFLLIAKTKEGYRQLKTLSSRAWERSYKQGKMYRSPTFYQDVEEIVGANPGHIIATSACPGGEIGYCIENHEEDRLNKFMRWCIRVFGKENFFLEMQDSDAPNQQIINQTIMRLSEFFDVPYILTSDVHYVDENQKDIHAAFLNSKEEKERETEAFYKYTSLKPEERMRQILSYLPKEVVTKAMENTQLIYNAVENFDIRHSMIVPQIKIPQTGWEIDEILISSDKPYIQKFVNSPYEQDRYWAYLIGVGIRKKMASQEVDLPLWLERINTEMEIVWAISEYHQQRVSAYFNMEQKLVDTMWEVSLVGCGRGSAPGFLTNWLIGLTQFSPLQWNLPEWRFLNLERLDDFPDVDEDSDGSKSDEILKVLRREFGEDCVLNTLTFHTESLKSAILTAARGVGLSSDEAQIISSMVPIERGKVASLSDCLGETDGVEEVPGFRDALERNGILDIVREIEGIESGAGVHASSVYVMDKGYLDHNSLMLSSTGAKITCWDMHDSDACGAVKYDLLKVDALTKMSKCLQLLLDDRVIEWQGTLRATYDKYLHPDVLDFNDPKVWDIIDAGRCTDLFQMVTQVGTVAIQKVQPRSILELSLCNDGMRLQGTLNGLAPIDRFAAFKKDISLWYKEMEAEGLTQSEQHILEKYVLPTYGNSINQETLMRILMDPQISNFTLRESNNARKILAKKLIHKVEELKQQYYQKATDAGTRKVMADYCWKYLLEPQLGYSFSTIHSHAYSIIGYQEAWLATHYNHLYWDCACLSVNAGSADTDFDDYGDEEAPEDVLEPYEQEMVAKKGAITNYGKVAKALGDIKARGVVVELPDINRAQGDFTPDTKKGTILYGLSAVAGINADTISAIVSNRPYISLADFLSKVTLTNVQMISLIKSGAFDLLEKKHRTAIMNDYLMWFASQKIAKKAKLTMANFDKALELKIIPDKFALQTKLYYFKKWIDKNATYQDAAGKKYYNIVDTDAKRFFTVIVQNSLTSGKDYDIIPNGFTLKPNSFKKFFDNYCLEMKEWMLSDEAVEAMYVAERQAQVDEWKSKYCNGTISKWEMDSLSYYYSGHELAKVDNNVYGIVNFNSLPENPVPSGYRTGKRNNVEYPVYALSKIAGTVLNADKTKHIVSLLTIYGVVDVKFFKMAFINYNKRISKIDEKGKKTVIEGSWFTRGNLLLISGLRKENMFSPRTDYAAGRHTSVSLITSVNGKTLTLKNAREKGV